LVIASPQSTLLPGEVSRLQDYLEQGGNLWLLSDPDNKAGADLMRKLTPVEQLTGTIVDANVKQLGIDNPAIALVPQYPVHDATKSFNLLSLFPQAAALQAPEQSAWQISPLLQTLDRSWNETGALSGEIERNPELGEKAGPLTLGYALSRAQDHRMQHIMLIGDGDFLSNSYLDNAGNRDLGVALIRWLVGNEQQIGIPSPETDDRELHLSRMAMGILGLGPLFVLPMLLLLVGAVMAWRRNRV
jgi:hypothetical protein